MLCEAFSDFIEFKNTKEGKKVDKGGKEELHLTFAKVSVKATGKTYVRMMFSPALVKDMEENKITTFKLLYHEKSFNVLLKYDNSSKAFKFENNKIRPNGSREYIDKYVTAVMLDLMEDKNAKGLTYKGKYMKDKLAYLFTLSKIKKGE